MSDEERSALPRKTARARRGKKGDGPHGPRRARCRPGVQGERRQARDRVPGGAGESRAAKNALTGQALVDYKCSQYPAGGSLAGPSSNSEILQGGTQPMKIRPLHDRLLVERLEEKEVKKGGIIIPDTAKEKPQEAKVIAVGNGKVTDEGKKIRLDVKAGDKILFGKFSGSEVKIDDKEYLILREEDVLAILE